jgi:signal transduction histidine kinase
VRDTGVGIPSEQLSRIFEPFYTTKAQGTGLGLAIAKKFTEAQAGTLRVWSRPGQGTTFRVTFPGHSEA